MGVLLESLKGKNDGSVAGVRYFECAPNCGLFVKRAQVKLDRPEAGGAPTPAPAPAAAVDAGQSHSDRLAALRKRRQSAMTDTGTAGNSSKRVSLFGASVVVCCCSDCAAHRRGRPRWRARPDRCGGPDRYGGSCQCASFSRH